MGVAKVDNKNTVTKIHTIIDGFPVNATILSVSLMPRNEPHTDQTPIHKAYERFKKPFK
jgi:hypothetical protein